MNTITIHRALLAGTALCLLGTAAQAQTAAAPAPLTSADEIVVTAGRTPGTILDTPFTVSVVDRTAIELAGATKLEDALRAVPGLQFGTQGNAYPRIATRGFRDTADVLVLVDGVPFRQLNGSADLIMLPVGIVDRIEFVKGPGSAVYGRGAIGGVMQLFTRPDGDAASFDGQLLGGSFDYGEGRIRGTAPVANGNVHMQAGASFSDGFQDRTDRKGQYVSGGVHQRLGETITFDLDGAYSHVESLRGSIIPLIDGRPAYGVDRKVNYGIPGAQIDGNYGSVSGKLGWTLGDFSVSNLLNWSRYGRFATGGITIVPAPTASSRGWSESDTTQKIWYDELVARYDRSFGAMTVNLLAGGSYEDGDLSQNSPSFSNAPTYRAPNFTTPVSNPANDPKGNRGALVITDSSQKVGSLFANAELHYGRLDVVGGLRWDSFKQRLDVSNVTITARQKAHKTTVRLGASVAVIKAVDNTVSLFGNYAEGFKPQFVAFSTLSNVTLPQLLRPEFTKSYEGGVKTRLFGGRASMQASYFDINRLDAQRSFRTGPDTFLITNASQRVKGVEAEVQAQIVPGLNGYATYAHHNPRNTKFVTTAGDFSGGQIRMQPRDYWGAGATAKAGPFTMTGSANYVGRRPLRDNVTLGTSQILPGYTLLNASVRWTHDTLFVQVAANNLTDKFYISDDFSSQNAGNAGAPRSIVGSVGVHF